MSFDILLAIARLSSPDTCQGNGRLDTELLREQYPELYALFDQLDDARAVAEAEDSEKERLLDEASDATAIIDGLRAEIAALEDVCSDLRDSMQAARDTLQQQESV